MLIYHVLQDELMQNIIRILLYDQYLFDITKVGQPGWVVRLGIK